jgi:hypothetical protein
MSGRPPLRRRPNCSIPLSLCKRSYDHRYKRLFLGINEWKSQEKGTDVHSGGSSETCEEDRQESNTKESVN